MKTKEIRDLEKQLRIVHRKRKLLSFYYRPDENMPTLEVQDE